jgi:hypothetical protein
MPEVIVSGNLNTLGNAGQFETDRSTWGFADGFAAITRSNEQLTAGLYSAKCLMQTITPFEEDFIREVLPGRFIPEAGKKYLVKVNVRAPSGLTAPADATSLISFKRFAGAYPQLTEVSFVTKTVAEATDAWVTVEGRYTCASNPSALASNLAVGFIGTGAAENFTLNGILYVDQFEVYEYIEVDEDPEPEPEEEFDQVYWSKNPVAFSKNAPDGWDEDINPRMYADIRVEDEAGSGIYNSKMATAVPPESNGQATFQVREAFRGVLTATPPTLNHDTLIRLTDRIKWWKHYTGYITGTDIDTETLVASNASLIVMGGLSKRAWATSNFFTDLITTKKFMTWAPDEKNVDRQQEDYLNFFVYTADIAQVKLKVKVYFDDDTDDTATDLSLVVQYGQLVQIPAGPANSGALLINPAKTVVKYELSLLDQDNQLISEVRTYLVDAISHPRKKFFMFLNSLGAYEVLRFTGVSESNTNISKDQIVKFLPHSYEAIDGEKEINTSALQNSVSHGSGFLKSKDWLDYMRDFLLSTRVFDVTDGLRLPVTINGGDFNMGADQVYERFIRFTAMDSYQDENYTP